MKKNDCFQNGLSLCIVVAIGITGLTGCGRLTSGKIYVDKPEVFTRERLLARRHSELQWLEKKLDFDELDTRFQGFRDVRVLDQFLSKREGKFDPLGELDKAVLDQKVGNIDRQNELNSLNQQIKVLELQNKLDNLKTTPSTELPKDSGNTGDSGAVTKADLTEAEKTIVDQLSKKIDAEVKPPAPSAGVFISKTTDGKLQLSDVPDPKQIETTKAKLSHVDQLRDELAYRDTIQAVMREKELDDSHDLLGQTIYTLKFDMSVVPGDNTRDLGKVNFTLVGEGGITDNTKNLRFKKWYESLEKELNQEALDLQRRWIMGYLTDEERVEILNTAMAFGQFIRNSDVSALQSYSQQHLKDNTIQVFKSSVLRKLTPFLRLLDKPDPVGKEEREQQWVKELFASLVQYRASKYLKTGNQYIAEINPPVILNFNDGEDFYILTLKELENTKDIQVKRELLENHLESFYAGEGYVYSIEPKEHVQNISDVAAIENLKNHVLSLQGSLPQYGVSVESYDEALNRSRTLLHAIKRAPLAVGYIDHDRTFGWILGPKFNIEEDIERPVGGMLGLLYRGLLGDLLSSSKDTVTFLHTPVQYSFQVSIVVPLWWSSIKLTSQTQFLSANSGKSSDGEFIVHLPSDPSAITTALKSISERPKPRITPRWDGSKDRQKIMVPANRATDLLIRGSDLWRNPEVFIGFQRANSTQILPDMGGLVAHFDSITLPPRINSDQNPIVDLTVITSNGPAVLRDAVMIIKKDETSITQDVRMVSTKGVKGDLVWLSAATTLIPEGFNELQFAFRPIGQTHWEYSKAGPDELSKIRVEGKRKLIPFKLTYASWPVNWGPEVDTTEMQGDLLIRLLEGGGLKRIVESEGIKGTFIYFKTGEVGRAYLDSSTSTLVYQITKEDDSPSEVTINNGMVLKIKNKELFYKAYPGLKEALKSSFILTLMRGTGSSVESHSFDVGPNGDFIPTLVQQNVSEDELIIRARDFKVNSTSAENLKWLFNQLKVGGPQNFSLELLYAKDKKLLVNGNLDIIEK